MGSYLKRSIVVENVSGAGGLLAIRQTLNSPPDGHMVLIIASTLVASPYINPTANYSISDFAAIGEMVRAPLLLVTRGSSPYKTLSDLIAAAKSRPGEITFGSSGIGTTNHISVELLANEAGVKFTHIPYKGISAAIPDVIAGRVDFMMSTSTSVIESIKSGAMKALYVSSKVRNPRFSDVPTVIEAGYPGATYEIWAGAFTRAGIPPEAQRRLAEAMEAARNDPDVQHLVEQAGQEISGIRTPEQFEVELKNDDKRLGEIIKAAKISPQ
jgi:tripartite-type tricarboxylate transporter receptor subunit TctC